MIGFLEDFLFLVVAASAVLFLTWLWRSVKNQEWLGRSGAPISPLWSVLWWFIPIANLFMPRLAIQELWRSSAPGTCPGTEWRAGPRSGLIDVWWTFFVLNVVFVFFGNSNGPSVADVRHDVWRGVAQTFIWVCGAVLLLSIVRRISARQQALLERAAARP